MKKVIFALAMLVSVGAMAQHGGPALTTADVTPELIILGTTGKTEAFAKAMGGESKGKISGAFHKTEKMALTMEEVEMNAGFFGFAPEIAIVGHLTYRMVAPAVVSDNFVVTCSKGWTRYDLGQDMGEDGSLTIVSMGSYMKDEM